MFPSLVSVGAAAKSFVFPRCSNFIFSRPRWGTICRGAPFLAHKDTRYLSIGQYLGFCRYRCDSG
jgi:hypothetical protein